MSIRFNCPQCGHRLKADENAAGSRAMCTRCRTVVTIPAAPATAAGDTSGGDASGVGSGLSGREGSSGEPDLAAAADNTTVGASGGDPGPVLRRRTLDADDEIDMTPMIDVVFQLLIFFMVTAAFALQKSLPVPEPQTAGKQQQAGAPIDRDAITVRIDADDAMWVDGAQAVSRQDLISKLRKLRGGAGGRHTLVVSADPDCRHESVVTALDAGSAAGMEKVELVTDEEEP